MERRVGFNVIYMNRCRINTDADQQVFGFGEAPERGQEVIKEIRNPSLETRNVHFELCLTSVVEGEIVTLCLATGKGQDVTRTGLILEEP